MTNKKSVLIGSFTAVIAAGAIGVSAASADFDHRCQNHAAVEDTIGNNNFKAFKVSTEECSIADNINTRKELNAIMVAHGLRQDGKYKQARQILEDAGIEHPGRKVMKYKRNSDMRNAIKNSNWTEFKHITEGKKIANIINTKEKFHLLAEAHELHKDGRHGEAYGIMSKLGLHHMK